MPPTRRSRSFNPRCLPSRSSRAPASRFLIIPVSLFALATPAMAQWQWVPYQDINGIEITSSPAAVRRSSSQIDVFYRGANNHLWTSTFTGYPWWDAPQEISNIELSSVPSAIARGNDLHVFYRGSNYHLWTSTWTGYPWWDAALEINNVEVTSNPVAVLHGNDIYVFYRGPNNHLWLSTWTGYPWWDAPQEINDVELTSDPAVVVRGNNVHVFYRGPNNHLWTTTWTGYPWWDAPQEINDVELQSRPTAALRGSEIDVFYRGPNGHLWMSSWTGYPWWDAPYEISSANVVSNPLAIARRGTDFDIWYSSDGDHLWRTYWASGWWWWEDRGGTVTSSHLAATYWLDNIDVFYRGANNHLYYLSYAYVPPPPPLSPPTINYFNVNPHQPGDLHRAYVTRGDRVTLSWGISYRAECAYYLSIVGTDYTGRVVFDREDLYGADMMSVVPMDNPTTYTLTGRCQDTSQVSSARITVDLYIPPPPPPTCDFYCFKIVPQYSGCFTESRCAPSASDALAIERAQNPSSSVTQISCGEMATACSH